jgi:hypothetical protein
MIFSTGNSDLKIGTTQNVLCPLVRVNPLSARGHSSSPHGNAHTAQLPRPLSKLLVSAFPGLSGHSNEQERGQVNGDVTKLYFRVQKMLQTRDSISPFWWKLAARLSECFCLLTASGSRGKDRFSG